MKVDVVIIGAGAAGLACAAELAKHEVNFLILEARSRWGGRVYSKDDESAGNIELGAEFIHGVSPALFKLIDREQIPFIDVCEKRLYLNERGKLEEIPKFYEHFMEILPPLSKKRKTDETVQEFLRRKKLSKKWRGLFRGFIEGFHAADLDRIGLKGLLQSIEVNDSDLNGVQSFRPAIPYREVLEKMMKPVGPERIRLHSVVSRIKWARESVEVSYHSSVTGQVSKVSASRLVSTVPLGCLKNGDIQWDPLPGTLSSSISSMQMGFIERLVFQFRERFWEDLRKDQQIAFLHAGADHYFPTWWTLSPLRNGVLVAWQGGPKAQEMTDWSLREKIVCALETLTRLTGRSPGYLEKTMVSCHAHNWSQDVFSRGAYSYILKDGTETAAKLKNPIERTLYFAGEAFCFDADRATVHGAIKTGREAAHKILKSFVSKTAKE